MAGFGGGMPPVDLFFGGVSTLSEQLDKRVLLVLRDGKHLVGTLISYDHFGSLLLKDACERHVASGKFCDIDMGGIYLVRGENLTMLGEIDEHADAQNPLLQRAEWEEVRALQEEEQKAKKAAADARRRLQAISEGAGLSADALRGLID